MEMQIQAGTCDCGLLLIATATALLNGMYLQSKVRWKESEVAIQRNIQSFLIVGCQSVLREPWWNAKGACLQWYHHDCVASVPEDAAREL